MPAMYFTIRWSGFIKASPGDYSWVVSQDGGMRVWLEEKLILDKWGESNVRSTVKVQLTGAYQKLKVEYLQRGGASSHAGIGWMPPGTKNGKAQTIPADVLYHTPLPSAPVGQPSIGPTDEGVVTLLAKLAAVRGFGEGRLSNDAHERMECVSSWTSLRTWVNWDFEVADAGVYTVDLVYCCGANGEGSFDVLVGESSFQGTATSTGGWTVDELKTVRLGTLPLETGVHSLALKPTAKPHLAVMNLSAIILTRVR